MAEVPGTLPPLDRVSRDRARTMLRLRHRSPSWPHGLEPSTRAGTAVRRLSELGLDKRLNIEGTTIWGTHPLGGAQDIASGTTPPGHSFMLNISRQMRPTLPSHLLSLPNEDL